MFSAEKKATIHLIIPTIAVINGHINKLLMFHEQRRDLQEFLQTLKTNINKKFSFLYSDDENVYVVATYLSPIHSQVLNEYQVRMAEKILESYYSPLVDGIPPSHSKSGKQLKYQVLNISV